MDADRKNFEAWARQSRWAQYLLPETDPTVALPFSWEIWQECVTFRTAHSAAQPAGVEDARDGALLACRAACDRIIDQYEGWGVHCGIDFHALRKGIDAASKGEAA